jgi:hypothetical protein
MGKSFRNTTSKPAIDTKKDFLDLLEDENPGKKPTRDDQKVAQPATAELPETVRQTFIIGTGYLDKMKDLVYTKRRAGEFEYSQKDAIHEALDMLFNSTMITKRPVEVRAKEEKRNLKIREGRR